jgi:glutamate dehydrogenase (NAD(P)+)
MTPKNAIDPNDDFVFGSGKNGVRVPQELGQFMRSMKVGLGDKLRVVGDIEHAFVREALGAGAISAEIGPRSYTFAPDEGTSSFHMAAVVNSVETETGLWVPAIATAKPTGLGPDGEPHRRGGIEGRNEATGRGIVDMLKSRVLGSERLMEKIARSEDVTVGLDGFGGVGSWVYESLMMHMRDDPILSRCSITGIADATGTYFDKDGVKIMDIPVLRGLEVAEGATPDLSFASRNPERTSKDSRDVLTMDLDVLIVASVANRICSAQDMSTHPDETRFGVTADQVKAKYVIEGGNGSITHAGQDELEARGVIVDTGIGANSAGAAGSWIEHNFGLELMNNPLATAPTLEETRQDIDAAMLRRFRVIEKCATDNKISRPLAAYVVAMSKLLDAA